MSFNLKKTIKTEYKRMFEAHEDSIIDDERVGLMMEDVVHILKEFGINPESEKK